MLNLILVMSKFCCCVALNFYIVLRCILLAFLWFCIHIVNLSILLCLMLLVFVLCSVPPQIITFPKDQEVTANNHIVLECEAEGVPTPTISWKVNGTDYPSEWYCVIKT